MDPTSFDSFILFKAYGTVKLQSILKRKFFLVVVDRMSISADALVLDEVSFKLAKHCNCNSTSISKPRLYKAINLLRWSDNGGENVFMSVRF